jgi:histone deacetylase 6
VQRAFYDDPRVLYFSIHRFEHGKFWPNLRESDFDYVGGSGEALGKNINIPLNKIGMTNADYLAIFQQILLPVSIEV